MLGHSVGCSAECLADSSHGLCHGFMQCQDVAPYDVELTGMCYVLCFDAPAVCGTLCWSFQLHRGMVILWCTCPACWHIRGPPHPAQWQSPRIFAHHRRSQRVCTLTLELWTCACRPRQLLAVSCLLSHCSIYPNPAQVMQFTTSEERTLCKNQIWQNK